MGKALDTLIGIKRSEQTEVNVKITEIHQNLKELSENLENEVKNLKLKQEEELKRLKEQQEADLQKLRNIHNAKVAEISERAKTEVTELREKGKHIQTVMDVLSNEEFFLKTSPAEAIAFIKEEFVKDTPELESKVDKILLNCINEQLEIKKNKKVQNEPTENFANNKSSELDYSMEPIRNNVTVQREMPTTFETSLKNELFQEEPVSIERSKRLV